MKTIIILGLIGLFFAKRAVPCFIFEHCLMLSEKTIDVIKNSYALKSSTINIISDAIGIDLLDLIVQQIDQKVSVTLEISSNIQQQVFRRSWNIFLIDSPESFKTIYDKISPSSFNFHGHYTIVWLNRKSKQTKGLFELMWMKQIYNVVVLSVEGSKVKAQNFQPFNSESCNDVKPREVFNIQEYFDVKINDLKLCPLNVHAPNWAPFIFLDNGKATGRDFDVVEILAKALNFKPNVTIFIQPASWGMLFENGTATGVIANLLDSSADMIVGDYYLRAVRTKFMDASVEYFNADIVFVIPPGRNLESIEKILQPFNEKLWFALGIATVGGLLYVLILNIWTKGVYKSRLVTLCFNAISIMLAVSLNRLPSRSFLRLIFASFVIVSLILQAAYQGSLYRFLRENSKSKEVQSIDEMIEENYKIYSYDSMLEVIQGEKKIVERCA
jgi:Bacterial extracellular solute-binding proteins, family 3